MIGRAALLVAVVATLPVQMAAEDKIQFHRQQACEKTPDGWCVARSTGGGFAVELPMPFNDFSLPGQTFSTGGKGNVHVVGGVLPETGKLSATCSLFVEGRPDAKTIYANLAETLDASEPFVHKGFAGRRYRNSKPAAEMVAFVEPDFMCLLIAEASGDAALPAPMLERFFGSFSFPTGPTPPDGPK